LATVVAWYSSEQWSTGADGVRSSDGERGKPVDGGRRHGKCHAAEVQ